MKHVLAECYIVAIEIDVRSWLCLQLGLPITHKVVFAATIQQHSCLSLAQRASPPFPHSHYSDVKLTSLRVDHLLDGAVGIEVQLRPIK